MKQSFIALVVCAMIPLAASAQLTQPSGGGGGGAGSGLQCTGTPLNGYGAVWNSTTGRCEWAPLPGATGGEANDLSEFGTVGAGLRVGKSGTLLQIRKIASSNNLMTVDTSGTADDYVRLTINAANFSFGNVSTADTIAVGRLMIGKGANAVGNVTSGFDIPVLGTHASTATAGTMRLFAKSATEFCARDDAGTSPFCISRPALLHFIVDTGSSSTSYSGCNGLSNTYTNGMVVNLVPNTSNTGPATLNVCGLGTRPIKHEDGSDLSGGELFALRNYLMTYQSAGSVFQMHGSGGGPGGGEVTLSTPQTLTNKTLNSATINSPAGLVKADVGLDQVDNTSDATKNAAVANLENKTLLDATTFIADSGDPTKQARFEANGITPGVIRSVVLHDSNQMTVQISGSTAVAGQFVTGIDGSGIVTRASPSFTGMTGIATVPQGGTGVATLGTGVLRGNGTGNVSNVTGLPSDCVRVDGNAGPCTGASGLASSGSTGIIVETAPGITVARSVTGSGPVTVTNGPGTGGNINIDVDCAYVWCQQDNAAPTGIADFKNAASMLIKTGTAAPASTDCDVEAESGRIYLRSTAPATANSQASICKQVGLSSYAWSPMGHGTGGVLPATCAVGEVFFNTAVADGSNWVGCTAANTWTSMGAGSLPVTTKGDLLTYSTVPARLPAGADRQALRLDSTQGTGLRWATESVLIKCGTGGSTSSATSQVLGSADLTGIAAAGGLIRFVARFTHEGGILYQQKWSVDFGGLSISNGAQTNTTLGDIGYFLKGSIGLATTATQYSIIEAYRVGSSLALATGASIGRGTGADISASAVLQINGWLSADGAGTGETFNLRHYCIWYDPPL